MAELEFEMSDAIKLEDLGFNSDFLENFQAKYPDKLVFTKKDTASNDFFMYHLTRATLLRQLTLIDQTKLTASQKDKLNSKIRDFEQVQEVTGKEVELNEPTETEQFFDESFEDPTEEMFEVEVLVEDNKGNMQDVDKQGDLINMYIEKNGELQTLINKRDSKIKELNIQLFSLGKLSIELAMIFGRLGITEDLSKESEKTLEALFA